MYGNRRQHERRAENLLLAESTTQQFLQRLTKCLFAGTVSSKFPRELYEFKKSFFLVNGFIFLERSRREGYQIENIIREFANWPEERCCQKWHR